MAERRLLIVTTDTNDIAAQPEQVVVTADEYLEGSGFTNVDWPVVNLCRDLSYGSKGYYVSLLADARGQQVLPSVPTITGLAEPYARFRALQEAGAPTIDAAEMAIRRRVLENAGGVAVALEDRQESAFPTPLVADPQAGFRTPGPHEVVEAFVYLGTCADPRFQQAARAVFREWPAPLLRMQVVLDDGSWKISQVRSASAQELTPAQSTELTQALSHYRIDMMRLRARETVRASIAVLVDSGDVFSPSSPETIDRLERVAARMDVHLARITLADLRRLPEYDALFIRSHTSVTHPAFQFAMRAEALGMPVIDAAKSTIRCTNKVFMEELLARACVPTPRSCIITANTPYAQIEALGYPFVLKLPDGDFSAAVHKVSSPEDYQRYSADMFARSPLLIAQEWLPTEFDWRIGVLGGKLLFAAKYYMAHGHWQIRTVEKGTERYGKVVAVARAEAPPHVTALAIRAAALIGDGFYGVDIKDAPGGPVVIEVNDNPNLDIGYEDTADGDVIYQDIVQHFLDRIEAGGKAELQPSTALQDVRAPISAEEAPRERYGFFEVAGLELEYPIVDRDLNVVSLVEPAFRIMAGRGTSDVDLGAIGFSNEFADHVFELKTQQPLRSLKQIEALLFEGVQRFTAVLRDEFDARLFPTAMHPWFDPMTARLWTRSGLRVYTTYARIFNVRTHGWMNVQASHLNLPFGTEAETVAMYNAAALLLPYLPALAASSPIYDGELQQVVDARMECLMGLQARVPESCGRIIPEFIEGFADYRKNVLQPMYAAVDRLPDAGALRYEYFNARAANLRFARRALEIRVLDTQECVKMDVAVAAFTKYALQHLTQELLAGRLELPDHDQLVGDFQECIARGSAAQVSQGPVREVLARLLAGARRYAPDEEAQYLDLAERIIESGSLAEKIRSRLEAHAGKPAEEFKEAARHVYIQLADCLDANEPWEGRWR